MSSGIPENHVILSLKDNASCVCFFFLFSSEKGASVKSEENNAKLKKKP